MPPTGAKSTIIDLTMEPIDHVTALPSELIHMVIGNLLPNHEPDIAYDRFHIEGDKPHPLAAIAATCRTLRSETEQWALHFLKQHSTITHVKKSKITRNENGMPKALHGTSGLLHWIKRNCAFCGKNSVRAAILANGLRCCAKCDREQWPDKITKTEAKKAFHLKDHHLLPDKYGHGYFAHPKADDLPRLHYGTYMVSSVATTMFLRKDVKALAEFVHGDVELHMEKKKKKDEERDRKKKARAVEAAAKAAAEAAEEAAYDDEDDEWERVNTPFQRAARRGESNADAMAELTQLIRQFEGGAQGFMNSSLFLESLLADIE